MTSGRPSRDSTDLGSGRGPQLPLVVLLHGYGASGELQDLYLGVSATGADLGYLTLTPDGTADARGNRFWNASNLGSLVDDTGYLVGLIDRVIADYNADPNRVYLVGHSNGGFMANKIACEMPDRIAGIAAIAGGIFGEASDCVGPMRVIFVQGTDDGTVPYEGASFLGAPVLGAEDTVDRWRKAGGCSDDVSAGGTVRTSISWCRVTRRRSPAGPTAAGSLGRAVEDGGVRAHPRIPARLPVVDHGATTGNGGRMSESINWGILGAGKHRRCPRRGHSGSRGPGRRRRVARCRPGGRLCRTIRDPRLLRQL